MDWCSRAYWMYFSSFKCVILVFHSAEQLKPCLLHFYRCDLGVSRLFFKNIILSGGSTLFKGIEQRLLSELKKVDPTFIMHKHPELSIFVSICFDFFCIHKSNHFPLSATSLT